MEIEVRAFIDDIPSFIKRILALGGTPESEKHIIDYWYCTKESTEFAQVQQHEPGSYALRIRQSIKGDKTTTQINSKVLTTQGDHNAFLEHETVVENFSQMDRILKSIGFKTFCIVDKKRRVFKFEHCLINVEEIKGFRPAVELEIISDKDPEQHKAYMRDILDKLRIKEENRIEKSITFLYMKEFSFKGSSDD
jgi:predicted adenylyl cyclase CyaB